MTLHILTNKNLNDPANKDFLERAGKRFFVPDYMTSTDATVVYYYRDGKITKGCSLSKYEKESTRLLLANQPLSFLELAQTFPNWVIAGYAHDRAEAQRIQKASGIENVLVFDRVDKNWKNTLKYGYMVITYSRHFKGILTLDNIDAVVAEESRRDLMPLSGCLTCDAARHYKSVQEWFLERDGSKEDNLMALFSQSPISGKVPVSKYPILGNIGSVCKGNKKYHPNIPVTEEECAGQEREDKAVPEVERFLEQYRELIRKVGESHPT